MLKNNIEPKIGMRVRRFQNGKCGTMSEGDIDTIIAIRSGTDSYKYLTFKKYKNSGFASNNYELAILTSHFSIY